MKLLGTPGSPYARKVRIVLAEKRIPYEYVIDRPSILVWLRRSFAVTFGMLAAKLAISER